MCDVGSVLAAWAGEPCGLEIEQWQVVVVAYIADTLGGPSFVMRVTRYVDVGLLSAVV